MLEITRTVNIKIDEAGMKQLIIDKVAAHDPNIVIDEITFIARRNPPSMDAVIVAHMETIGHVNAPVTKDPVSAEEDSEEDSEEYEEDDLEDKADELDPATAFLESEDTPDTEKDPFLEEEPKKKGRKPKATAKEEEEAVWPDDSSDEEEEEEEDPFL